MKQTSFTINLSSLRKMVRGAGDLGKAGITLGMYTIMLFILLTIGSILQTKLESSPVSSMKGLAASVSNQFFIDMLGLEMPHFINDHAKFTFSDHNILSFAFRFLTDINPGDPKSLLAREVPGLSNGKTTVLRASKTESITSPEDLYPSSNAIAKVEEQAAGTSGAANNNSDNNGIAAANDSGNQSDSKPPATAGKRVAFIYQSHSTESFLPELKGVTDPGEAYDSKINVGLVGKRLAENLIKDGIGAVQSRKMYSNSTVKGFKYEFSYKYSLQTLREAAAVNPDLKYYFDIHRDSQDRGKTTVSLNGKDYAQVYFIIGGGNPNWKQNEAFASQIHDILEKEYPGISKGIHAKTPREGNGIYNQNFSPNSVLVEIGGPYNSLEECYRTTDILANAISQAILNAEKVNAPVSGKKDPA